MKGRQPGRPIKWTYATINERVYVGRPGIVIEVWNKWKRRQKKLGTLTINVAGLWWAPHGGKPRRRRWDKVHKWFMSKG